MCDRVGRIRTIRIERDTKSYRGIIAAAVLVGIGLKICLMTIFSSDYQTRMFMPFVNCFVEHTFNPYDFYYLYDQPPSFPYPPMMLWIASVGGYLMKLMNVTNGYAANFLFKLPLLLFDLMMFVFINKLCRNRIKYTLVFYFYSPIILYSTYMHGQLDIIPTAFLVAAIYFLLSEGKGSLPVFIVGLVCAITSKLHILAVVPLLFYYVYKKRGLSKLLVSIAGVCLGVAVIVWPFWGEGLVRLVLFAKENAGVCRVSIDYGDVKLYLAILAVCFLYLKIFQLKTITRELLLCFTGIIYMIFLVFVPPMPGWFVWIVPFIMIYFCEVDASRYRAFMHCFLFYLLYSVYFIAFHRTGYVDLYWGSTSLEFLKIDNVTAKSTCFTVLLSVLIMFICLMYQFGIQQNEIYRRNGLPFTLGIAGDSGTGKSELLGNIECLIDSRQILYIEGDGDHRWERGSDNWDQYTHLDPRANYLYRQASDIRRLRMGNSVRRVDYDHSTGTFTDRHRILPKPYIIMCGLHSLYLPQMRSELDLKIYLDTDENLRRYWKIQRDTGKRGYSDEEIIAQIEKRIPDAMKYIYPQSAYADLVIHYFDDTLTDCFDRNHALLLSLKITVKSSWNLDALIQEFEMAGFHVEHLYEEDLRHQVLIFKGEEIQRYAVDYEEISRRNFDGFKDIFPGKLQWKTGIDGIVQLLVVFGICRELTDFNK